MNIDPASDLQDELRPEYDTEFMKKLLKNGVRGKYAGKITHINGRAVSPSQTVQRLVNFSPEVAAAFPTDEAIDTALRSLIASAPTAEAVSSSDQL